jgi:hypothetical protein
MRPESVVGWLTLVIVVAATPSHATPPWDTVDLPPGRETRAMYQFQRAALSVRQRCLVLHPVDPSLDPPDGPFHGLMVPALYRRLQSFAVVFMVDGTVVDTSFDSMPLPTAECMRDALRRIPPIGRLHSPFPLRVTFPIVRPGHRGSA